MTTEVFSHELALAAELARRVADRIRRQPDIVLGLPTGRTPLALYRALVAHSHAMQVDWSHVGTFNLDEFVGCGEGEPGSYRSFMETHLFRHVNIQPERIGFLDGRAADLAAECARYERAIAEAGGIDLLILGIGANGHIGFNEPDAVLAPFTHRVMLDERSRAANALWFDGDRSRVPREALSMGMATILRARAIVLLATGEPKAPVVRAMLEEGVTTRLPASFLQLHADVTVMLDEAAATDVAMRR